MRRIYFLAVWSALAFYFLIFASILLVYISFTRTDINSESISYKTFQAQPGTSAGTSQEVAITTSDARPLIVAQFFKARKSPLADYAQEFVSVADKYKLDYRLMPAIAMHESQGGKIMPEGSNNPFGYGVYGGKVMQFDTFTAAIERVGQGLKTGYYDNGLVTPEQIMPKYTPPSLALGGAWAIGVSAFMDQLQ